MNKGMECPNAHDEDRPTVYFHSGSTRKAIQYQYLFGCYGYALHRSRLAVALTEPQVEGPGASSEIALVEEPLKYLARFAERTQRYPLVVEDTMLFVEHFNLEYDSRPFLPGPDTKRWWDALGDKGLLEMLRGSQRRRALYVCQLGVLRAKGDYRFFRAELSGRVAHEIRSTRHAETNFPRTNATYFHSVFVPDGYESTLAEMDAASFSSVGGSRRCVERAVTSIDGIARPATGQGRLFAS